MTLLILVIVFVPALLLSWFAMELIAGLARPRRRVDFGSEPISAVIVMPAQNEAAIIGPVLDRLTQAANGIASILLVADNCTDETAVLARAAGVQVSERFDRERRGKGFALAHAQSLLASDPPDIVVVIDADCTIDRASLTALIASARRSQRPVQAIYLFRSPSAGRTPVLALSGFAFLIKNLVRQRGLQRLAGCVHLTGTGMALPWRLFADAPLATASIVEDLKLGLDLARDGHGPLLVDDAIIWSDPSTDDGTLVQRRRWESGFLSTAKETAPRLVRDAFAKGDLRLLALALDLCIPPLALLMLLCPAVLGLALLLTLMTHAGWAPVLLLLAAFAAAAGALLAAWAREGRDFVSGAELTRIPAYILWKIPLYLGLGRPPAEWLRTGR